MKINLISLLITCGFFLYLTEGNDGYRREYCLEENFEAYCESGKVIVMTSARFGRMSLGRCIKRDIGHLGCSADALFIMDILCSGKQNCTFEVKTTLEGLRPCPMDTRPYLDAAYRCQEVSSCSPSTCQNGHNFELTASDSGQLLTNQAAVGNICGVRCPYLISVPPGQSIKLTQMYFATYLPVRNCDNIAAVTDAGVKHDLCSQDELQAVVYTSFSNSIVLEMSNRSTAIFGLKFEVIGCPDLKAPRYGHIKRDGDVAVVECNNGDKLKSFLNCFGTEWIGDVGECPEGQSEETVEVDGGCEELVLSAGYSTKTFEGKTFVTCDATGSYSMLECLGDQWVQKYPSTESLYFPYCY